MIAFFGNIKKEILLLLRDKAGLTFLFIMPIALVLLMTLLQDKTVKKLQQEQMDIVLVNLDNSIMGDAIIQGLKEMELFNVHELSDGDSLNSEVASQAVLDGEYQMGIIIPAKSSHKLKRIVSNELRKQMPDIGTQVLPDSVLDDIQLEIFFDPLIKASLRQAMEGALNQLLANVQSLIIFKSYSTAIEKLTGKQNNDDFPLHKFSILQTGLIGENSNSIPSSTQHNVPAWTVFAIFFMVIPLATQIISERETGSNLRMKMAPISFLNPLIAKIVVYSTLAVIQAVLLLIIGAFLLPLLGMDSFNIHGKYISFIVFTFIIGLAATSYGLVIGSIAKTNHQASIFGSISVVLLAAIGGIWVPMYMMPEALLYISNISPLNWALSGYYDIILKANGLSQLGEHIMKLILFIILSIGIAFIFENRKNR